MPNINVKHVYVEYTNYRNGHSDRPVPAIVTVPQELFLYLLLVNGSSQHKQHIFTLTAFSVEILAMTRHFWNICILGWQFFSTRSKWFSDIYLSMCSSEKLIEGLCKISTFLCGWKLPEPPWQRQHQKTPFVATRRLLPYFSCGCSWKVLVLLGDAKPRGCSIHVGRLGVEKSLNGLPNSGKSLHQSD